MSRNRPSWLLTILLLTGCGTGKANPKALEQRLAAEIPLRSTSAQTIAFLNSQSIAHSAYRRTENCGNSVEAEMKVPAARTLVQPTYDVMFCFDEQGLLKSYDVQYLGYVGL